MLVGKLELRLGVNKAVGKENREVIPSAQAYLGPVLARLQIIVDGWNRYHLQLDVHDPVETIGQGICRQRPAFPFHRRHLLTGNQALARRAWLVEHVAPML